MIYRQADHPSPADQQQWPMTAPESITALLDRVRAAVDRRTPVRSIDSRAVVLDDGRSNETADVGLRFRVLAADEAALLRRRAEWERTVVDVRTFAVVDVCVDHSNTVAVHGRYPSLQAALAASGSRLRRVVDGAGLAGAWVYGDMVAGRPSLVPFAE